jgi:Na+-transporting methylmalonyl-CoA/oxaloacetate decarboxylase gamma subunit
MQAQNTKQRVLFVGLMFMFVLSARLLVMSRAGAFLLAIVIVISGLCIGFRMVERLVAAMWTLAGMLATKFFRKPEESAETDPERLGSQ